MSTTTHVLSPSRLKPGDLKELAETTANPCVSILMRTHRSGPETPQGAIRFKNLLGQAKKKLEEAGHDCSILDPVESLSTSSDFWQHQNEGLAIFLAPDDCRVIKLQGSVDEHVSVGDSFFLLPLVRQLSADGTEYAERFGTALAQSKGSTDVEEVLRAAKTGRVESVMVCCNEADLDQANAVVGETLRQGGDAFLSVIRAGGNSWRFLLPQNSHQRAIPCKANEPSSVSSLMSPLRWRR